MRGIEDTLYRADHTPLFVSGHWNETIELNKTKMLSERKVDGIIIIKGKLSDQYLLALSQKSPTVLIGRQATAPQLPSINFDDTQGIHLLLNHLHELNHRNIAFISGPLDHSDSAQRFDAFTQHSKTLGLKSIPEHTIISNFQSSGGYDAIEQLLNTRHSFSAVVCANDQMAYGALLALKRASLRVPDDVSLVGFDDLPHSTYTIPPLTTARQSVFKMGELAAQSILDILHKKQLQKITIAAQIIVRESTGFKKTSLNNTK